jgi:hypothetical protein
LAYNAVQYVFIFSEHYILRDDNINNVVHLLNEEKEFITMKPVTDHNVRAFFEEEIRKYRRICELAELSYVYEFSKRLRTILTRRDCVQQHTEV